MDSKIFLIASATALSLASAGCSHIVIHTLKVNADARPAASELTRRLLAGDPARIESVSFNEFGTEISVLRLFDRLPPGKDRVEVCIKDEKPNRSRIEIFASSEASDEQRQALSKRVEVVKAGFEAAGLDYWTQEDREVPGRKNADCDN